MALRDKREHRHEEIKDLYLSLCSGNCLFYTTDYVLDETFTLLFSITAERFEKAKDLRIKFQDKPGISFTDLTSMVVMLETGITDILTEDDHFTQVGMGFQKIP
ncbi:MAG: type II toxin-antitoxin system VapC family toxin [Candidatus Syntrophoarchaeum sp.]|nr:type II toxin-antitoxin system VapC family toxin [Candidatus Syntrophoarchaeum sp.]